MADNQHFQCINKIPYFKEIYGKSKLVKTLVKSLFLPPQRTLDLEYQDGGDELQNLITEIPAMRDPGLLISADKYLHLQQIIRVEHARNFNLKYSTFLRVH